MVANIVPTKEIEKRPHLAEYLSRVDPVRSKLIFCLDATASRQPTWDQAAKLQAEMFRAVAAIGGLDVQLVYFRGDSECVASRWLSNPQALADIMSRVMCMAGYTQIQRVLAHTRKENARERVAALVVVGDACEEQRFDLYAEARELGNVPVFLFQEGSDEYVTEIFREIAHIAGGATCAFDAGSAQRLADLLKAVAVFATGGVKALAAEKSYAARLLLTQLKK
jgi:hypothetical protein